MIYLRLILLAAIGLISFPALADDSPTLSFKAAGDRLFDFDTGAVKGRLRANGKYQGISSMVDVETGKELTRSAGIFSYYRVLSTDQRWGDSARDWPMTATLLHDGAVQIDWPAQEEHPFEITATYRWKSPTTLDLETVVRPQRSMPRFEIFLSSYFDLNFKALAYAKPMRPDDASPEFIMADVNPLVQGSYLAFPTDRRAAQMFFDRRWAPENGLVPWAVTRVLGAPIGMKRDVQSNITFLLMSRPEDCFALSMSYNMDPPDGIAGHGSVYMSLFGKDVEAGASERAQVRLVVERNLSNQRAVELYQQYTNERPLVRTAATAGNSEEEAFLEGRKSAKIASYSLSKVQRWLHEVALKKIEPDTGLYHPDGHFNYQDAWADCYPFLAWAAWATDLEALNGPVREALHAEIKHCKKGFFSEAANAFGGSEYVKDGLVAIVEVTGKDEWFDRMKAIEDEIWQDPPIETPYGKIPSKNIEINGEQIQVLARLYTMTGEKKYLQWAERLADYYLLPGGFVPERLRDHGCEIIGGIGLLLGVESVHNPEKAKVYLPLVNKMLDAVLKDGINEDGIMFNTLGRKGALSDGWGYNYVAYLCYGMVAGEPVYREHMEQTLRNLSKPLYKNYPWEGRSIDGYADSIEGGLYIMNRLAVPEGLAWADREMAANVARSSEPLETARLWGTMKLESNGVRTTIIHALMHTRGLLARPWRQDLTLGASETKDGLAVVMKADKHWSGKLVFDIPRHRIYVGFKHDWPRMNTMPEWFTVEPTLKYVVMNVTNGSRKIYTGEQLHEGLPIDLPAGKETMLLIKQ